MSEISVAAKKRDITTKGALNQLRKSGWVPGVFYSKGQEALSFAAPERSVRSLVYTSDTHVVSLKIDDQEELKAILKNIQFDPLTDAIIHIDLLGITVGEELEIEVPVALAGSPIGVKEGGVLQHHIHKLLVACLPKHIPDNITLDVSGLKLGKSIHVKDIVLENVRILNAEEVIVASVTVPRAAAVEEPVDQLSKEATEPEVIGKGKQESEEE